MRTENNVYSFDTHEHHFENFTLIFLELLCFCCGVEKSQREEDRMVYEHAKEIQELRKEIREKDSLLDDLTQNSEVQIEVRYHDDTHTKISFNWLVFPTPTVV